MTKLIAVFVAVVVIYGGWHFFLYWERVKNDEAAKERAAAAELNPQYLSGMPDKLESTYQYARQKSNAAMKLWLKTYGAQVQDPRKAWIELDYCVAIAREEPNEARRIFREVKERTPATSPLIPRIKQLEKSYE